MLSAQIHSPFPDRSERAGTGHDRAHRDGEHPRQRIAHTSRVARDQNLAQHAQQGSLPRQQLKLWQRRSGKMARAGVVLERDGGCRNSHLSPKGHARHTRHADHTDKPAGHKAPQPTFPVPALDRLFDSDQADFGWGIIFGRLLSPRTP